MKGYSVFKAYTFIELMVVITIISFLSVMTYIPYSFYQNKEKLRSGAKEISQSISDARNLAINGLSNSSSNVSVGIYFDKLKKNKIDYFSYPYNYYGPIKVEENLSENIKLIKTRQLDENIWINSIYSKDNFLIIYDSITGNAKYFYKENTDFIPLSLTGIIDINIGLKGVKEGILSKTIKYNPKTYITDY
ncbi:MAG: prepilin-type N-terminal cleavage/methylation domain-containing protein [Candidatus Gracilibacteria bacterium]|nr:prepilin-type N-terminal cleavage/methylation domain-containing protein [Candidatus Gracilibacteria bacterium]